MLKKILKKGILLKPHLHRANQDSQADLWWPMPQPSVTDKMV